ncbi:uncharacterized protein PHALS_14674 [Plasmopara halstedii]|uniref:Uncharacterized protein n=1 Tax=Plasmopara halstedii TaxID=4781 RepID=A0A0P1AP62_PLAHL|nr:uncharacterized protein PHALS_14674 [Plasmopara halstedii]CEG42977.1 hypothetical protein PHALS_14674 [Plasmopara halstedii]|eukprot:XP_024579346.1 hypothetical protein PHALS_14674 [Plasmopara halstedii]
MKPNNYEDLDSKAYQFVKFCSVNMSVICSFFRLVFCECGAIRCSTSLHHRDMRFCIWSPIMKKGSIGLNLPALALMFTHEIPLFPVNAAKLTHS